LFMYTMANKYRLPPALNEIASLKGFPARVFLCPEDAVTPTKPLAAGSFGPCSYVYTYPGELITKQYPDTILAYEPRSNHTGRGMNVLYADGTVRWLDAKADQKMIADILGGWNHLRKPASRPSTLSTSLIFMRYSPFRSVSPL